MKKIKSIAANSFKIGTFTTNLSDVTLITGDNFAGKSSRIEAIILALAGYLPGVEKKPNAIHERLASDNTMTVTLTSTDGEIIVREWERNKKGAVSAKNVLSGLPEGWTAEPVVVDANEFLGLSEKARVKYLFNRTSLKSKVTTAQLIKLVGDEVEMNATNAKAVMEQIEQFKQTVEQMLKDNDGKVQPWLEALVEHCRKWKADAELTIRTQAAGTQVTGAAIATFMDADKVTKEYETARADYEQLMADVTRATEGLKALVQSFNESKAAAATDIQSQYDEAAKALSEAEKLLEANPPVDVEAGKSLATLVTTLSGNVGRLQNVVAIALAEKNARNEALVTAEREVAMADSVGTCPTCSCNIPEFVKNIVAKMEGNRDAVAEAYASAENAYNVVSSELDEAKRLHANKVTELEALRDKARRRSAITTSITGFKATLQSLQGTADKASKLQSLEKELATAQADAEKLAKKFETAATRFRDADEKRQKLAAQQAGENAIKSAAEKMETAEIELAVAKAATKALSAKLDELVEKSVGSVLDTMNDFCAGILKEPLAYEGGEIGMWQHVSSAKNTGRKFVSFRSFSGTEKALTQCAVSLALASEGQIRLAILDEMGRLDSKNKLAVVLTAVELIEKGKLDQAIFIDVSDDHYKTLPKVCKVVKL